MIPPIDTAEFSVLLYVPFGLICLQQMLKVTEDEPDLMLRVVVDGGGCSGFQYTIDFDTKVNPDDRSVCDCVSVQEDTNSLETCILSVPCPHRVFEREGVKVVADELTLELVDGCTVDYHTELIKSTFKIVGNPKAESTCSCGTSFAPK